MKRNGGNETPCFSRRLYFSTERIPLIPKFSTSLRRTFGSVSVNTRLASGINISFIYRNWDRLPVGRVPSRLQPWREFRRGSAALPELLAARRVFPEA